MMATWFRLALGIISECRRVNVIRSKKQKNTWPRSTAEGSRISRTVERNDMTLFEAFERACTIIVIVQFMFAATFFIGYQINKMGN